LLAESTNIDESEISQAIEFDELDETIEEENFKTEKFSVDGKIKEGKSGVVMKNEEGGSEENKKKNEKKLKRV